MFLFYKYLIDFIIKLLFCRVKRKFVDRSSEIYLYFNLNIKIVKTKTNETKFAKIKGVFLINNP